jgi:hypothetical protein
MLFGLQIAAITSVALCVIPAGAHFFERANKMALSPTDYMIVQQIYAGWAYFGIAVVLALLTTLAHTLAVRRNRIAAVLSFGSFVTLTGTQAIFWTWTYPMNVATQNWTKTPAAFEAARRQWEDSHAVAAVLAFAALLLLAASALIHNSKNARRANEARRAE